MSATVVAGQVRQFIGMRMALGATTRNIFRMIVRQGTVLSATGIVAGLVIAFWLSRLMTTLLVGVKPTDPATFAITGALSSRSR